MKVSWGQKSVVFVMIFVHHIFDGLFNLSFLQEYQVAYVIVKTGNAPRPKVWALERSVDGGRTFTPWEYFAPTPNDCSLYFRVSQHLPEIRDDTVICNTKVSDVPPFENGEVSVELRCNPTFVYLL